MGNGSPQPSLRSALVLYAITGWAQPLLIDVIKSTGATSGAFEMAPLFCNVMGMGMCNLLDGGVRATFSKATRHRLLAPLLAMTVVDIVSGIFCMHGQLLCGSQLYTVLYASTMLWTAVLSHWQGSTVSPQQWLAVLIISVGLVSDAFVSVETGGDGDGHGGGGGRGGGGGGAGVEEGEGGGGGDPLSSDAGWMGTPRFGVFAVLFGSFLHAAMFSMSERLLRVADVSFNGCDIGAFLGSIEALLLAAYLGPLYASASTEAVVSGSGEVVASGGGGSGDASGGVSGGGSGGAGDGDAEGHIGWYEAALFAILILIGALHAASFFFFLGQTGATTTGVLKGVQMLAVFVLSDMLFCRPGTDSTNCITFSKTCSVAMVVLGLCIYYNAKKLDIARVRRASDGGGLGPARGLAGGGSSGELLVAQQASSMEANEAKELRKERAEWKREADVL